MALLMGMGLKPEDVKRNDKYALLACSFTPSLAFVNVRETIGPMRPKGLGLGANPRAIQSAKTDNSDGNDKKDKLFWLPGARCQAVLGKFQGKYGMVSCGL